MAVYKDGDKWRVIYRYTNYKGERKQTQKRGFVTKREAIAWEHEVMLRSESKLDMTFSSFFEIYEEDKKKRVKENTWESKSHIIRTKILPFFGERIVAKMRRNKSQMSDEYRALIMKDIDGVFTSSKFIYYMYSALNTEKLVSGSAQPQVTVQAFKDFAIPLPPLAEQQRIVEQIESVQYMNAW